MIEAIILFYRKTIFSYRQIQQALNAGYAILFKNQIDPPIRDFKSKKIMTTGIAESLVAIYKNDKFYLYKANFNASRGDYRSFDDIDIYEITTILQKIQELTRLESEFPAEFLQRNVAAIVTKYGELIADADLLELAFSARRNQRVVALHKQLSNAEKKRLEELQKQQEEEHKKQLEIQQMTKRAEFDQRIMSLKDGVSAVRDALALLDQPEEVGNLSKAKNKIIYFALTAGIMRTLHGLVHTLADYQLDHLYNLKRLRWVKNSIMHYGLVLQTQKDLVEEAARDLAKEFNHVVEVLTNGWKSPKNDQAKYQKFQSPLFRQQTLKQLRDTPYRLSHLQRYIADLLHDLVKLYQTASEVKQKSEQVYEQNGLLLFAMTNGIAIMGQALKNLKQNAHDLQVTEPEAAKIILIDYDQLITEIMRFKFLRASTKNG